MRSSLRPIALALAVALGACSDPSAPSAVSPRLTDPAPAAADRVTEATLWNERTWAAVGRNEKRAAHYTIRAFALVSVAMYNAVIAAEDAKARGAHPSDAGALAAAAADVLAALYPAEQGYVAAGLAEDAAFYPRLPSEPDADWSAGVAEGRKVAAAVLAYAAKDGSAAAQSPVTLKTGAGFWTLAPPPAVPVTPLWGQVHPWLMTSASQFRPAPPPTFEASAEYARDLDEVRRYSSLSPTDPVRVEQLRIAQYWQFGPPAPGSTPEAYAAVPGWSGAGFFGAKAADLIARHHLDERRAARVYAVMYMAMMDATIGCYEAKYVYQYLRPWQADAAIATPVGRPNFPSYPSAHSYNTSSVVGALAGLFPSAADDLLPYVEEAGEARIVAGLHFRFDVVAGRELGLAVAGNTLRLAPDGHAPIRLPLE
jgi:membrane-associated phospholipid phosphatase